MAEKRFLFLSMKEKVLIIKRLSMLSHAGVPLVKSLRMMSTQSGSKSAKYILNDLVSFVDRGEYLHAGLEKYKKVFGDFAVSAVEVGEYSGRLQENLQYLSEGLRKKQLLQRQIWSALVYPIFIVLATFGVVFLLVGYIFPKILPIFSSLSVRLPVSTRLLIFLSNAFIENWIMIFASGLICLSIFMFTLRSQKVLFWVYGALLNIPLIGKFLRNYYTASITRTFGLLLKSDVSVVRAAFVTAKTVKNVHYKKFLEELSLSLTKGETISENLIKNSKIFPEAVGQMLSVGEGTGSLSDAFLFLADVYEVEVEEMTKNLTSLLEPVLLVFMGGLVGFVAVSVITPIYNITQNIRLQ